MNQENNVSSLQEHLKGADISVWETALNLKATKGFPYFDYRYSKFDWEYKVDYNNFIDFGHTANSLGGSYYDSRKGVRYDTTIMLYNGKYYVQVDKKEDGGYTEFYYDYYSDYRTALNYAYRIVFND